MIPFLILVPIAIAIIAKVFFNHSITLIEAAVQIVVIILIATGLYAAGRYSGATDYELWNGEITRKEIQRESCPQYWRDSTDWFCTEYRTRTVEDGPPRQVCSGEGEKRTCSWVQDYKTQYKYIYPWEQKFYLHTNVKETFYISRVDAQGAIVPPRYQSAYVTEPVAVQKSYSNWVMAASGSIFHEDGQVEEKYKDILPKYPLTLRNIYVADRIVTVGNVKAPFWLNDKLREDLRVLGPQRQMNVVFVLADADVVGDDFPYAVRRAWKGFKKNDAVIFLGLRQNKLVWQNVMSWSKKSIFDLSMRNDIAEFQGKEVDYRVVMASLMKHGIEHYERRSMKEFEHLKSQIPTPTWLTFLTIMLSVGGSLGLTWFFHKHDVFG